MDKNEAKKKELKKIEPFKQKLAWSEKDEEMCQETIDWFEKKCFPYALENDNPARESIKWLKSLKNRAIPQPKQEWSEEDERYYNSAKWHIKNSCGIEGNVYNWLKSLKDRVQPQPKQEWSEEKKARIDKIIDVLDWAEEKGHIRYSDWEDYVCYVKSLRPQNTTVTDEELAQAKKDSYNDALDKIEYHSGEPTFDDGWSAAIWYLKKKNAQPQNTWKPSDGQIKQLGWVAEQNKDNMIGKELMTLYNDLKKLREE